MHTMSKLASILKVTHSLTTIYHVTAEIHEIFTDYVFHLQTLQIVLFSYKISRRIKF